MASNYETIRLVHLSDIHFGQETAGQRIPYADVRDQLKIDVAKMRQSHGAATTILIAGDIAFSGSRKEYDDAKTWLDELCQAAGCEATKVCVVPGNHDVSRTSASDLTRFFQKNIRDVPTKSQDTLAMLAEEFLDTHPLLRTQTDYLRFAEQYGCHFESSSRPLWTKDFHFECGAVLRLVGLNTAQICNSDDREGNIILGNRQFTLPEQDSVVYVVMMHHPLSWLIDRIEAETLLYNRARVLITGHEHRQVFEKISRPQTGEILSIASGATTPPSSDGAKFTYNWLELAIQIRDGSAHLSTKITPRTWSPASARFLADHEITGGMQEHYTECINCGPISLAPSATQETMSNSEKTPVDSTDERFEHLRLLFWRLSDKERLQVLIELDLLPEEIAASLTLTDERIALNLGRQRCQLHSVWAAVAQRTDEVSPSNPFSEQE